MLLREYAVERWFVIPPLLTDVSAVICKNCIFSLACSISALPDFDQSLAQFIQSCSAVWLSKSCHHWSYALDHFGATAQKNRKMGVLHCSSWPVLNAISISALSCWNIKLSSMTCFITSNICWDNKISQEYCCFWLQVWWRIISIFDTVTDTVTDMAIVEHMGDIPNLSNFLPVGPVWCIQSIVFIVKDGLTVTRWYFNVFCMSADKTAYSIYVKNTISGFPVSPGSVETPVRWGGKIK